MIIRGGSNIVFDSWFVLIKYFRSDYIVHLWKLEEKNTSSSPCTPMTP